MCGIQPNYTLQNPQFTSTLYHDETNASMPGESISSCEKIREIETRIQATCQGMERNCIKIEKTFPTILREVQSIETLQQLERKAKEGVMPRLFQIAKIIVALCECIFGGIMIGGFGILGVLYNYSKNFPFKLYVYATAGILWGSLMHGSFKLCDFMEKLLIKKKCLWEADFFNAALDAQTKVKILALKNWWNRDDLPEIEKDLENVRIELIKVEHPNCQDTIDMMIRIKKKITEFYEDKRRLQNEMPLLSQFLAGTLN